LQRRYGDRAEFLAVYVREAHPTDGWRMRANDRVGISVAQPKAEAERLAVAHTCCSSLEINMPLLVDGMDDRVGHAYSGMPDRLYVIDRAGRVAYKSGRGPFGFKPGEMEQSLVMLLLDQEPPANGLRTALPSDEEAWRMLPPAEVGAGQPLPVWARALAPTMPRTVAAMLELDYLHRAASPLPAPLRAELRWIAARANRSGYSEAQAAADLKAAVMALPFFEKLGVDEAGRRAEADRWLRALVEWDTSGRPPDGHRLAAFARKMTLAAHTVSDAETEALIQELGTDELARLLGGCTTMAAPAKEKAINTLGQKQLVAAVQLLAYANFQDRLLLSLGISEEPGGPLPARPVRFVRPKGGQVSAPGRPPLPGSATGPNEPTGEPKWSAVDFDTLQKQLEDQRDRKGRLPVPTWEEMHTAQPQKYPAEARVRIKWSLVCFWYQPELAAAWSACTRAFAAEARQDRVFEESLFWVVTRSLGCFY
jgi:hypothetical protein